MTALTESKNIDEKEGVVVDHPVVASDIIYRGALVKHNAAGYLAPMAAEAGAAFAGVATEEADNSSGSAGDVNAKAQKTGNFLMVTSGASQSDVGSAVYASDDQTVSTTQGTNELKVGNITAFKSATEVWVRIDNDAV